MPEETGQALPAGCRWSATAISQEAAVLSEVIPSPGWALPPFLPRRPGSVVLGAVFTGGGSPGPLWSLVTSLMVVWEVNLHSYHLQLMQSLRDRVFPASWR